jgi:type 1 glutamine amidotransferase
MHRKPAGLLVIFVWMLVPAVTFGMPPRILILTGENNHDWRATTPVLQHLLEADGRFAVDVTTNVPELRPDIFARYDALLSNFNTYGQQHPGPVWDAAMREAFEKFIRSGHGFVVVHAGSAVFYDWPAFQEIAGATWGKGTSHGRMHTNEIHILSAGGPITDGLKDFQTFDEFWQNAPVSPGTVPLATVTPKPEFGGSGNPEPVAFMTHYGQGRGFTLLLGHDTHGMASPGFQSLLCRGAEWAATGKVSPENHPLK